MVSERGDGGRAEQATAAELLQRLGAAGASPRQVGRLTALFARPAVGARSVLIEGMLDPAAGLVGDNWRERGSRRTADGRAHTEMQLTLMEARVLAAVAGHPSRFALAGDQLIVDFALDPAHVPPGTEVAIGDAIVVITAVPHLGCAKFAERFGPAALALVQSPEGRARNLRGVYARVVRGGCVRVGVPIRRISQAPAPPAEVSHPHG